MGTKDGSGSHLMGLLCSAASTPWSFAFFCELTRWLMHEEGQRLRHRVISPSASADAVLYCCCRSLRRRRDGIGAEARPEKEGGRAGATRRRALQMSMAAVADWRVGLAVDVDAAVSRDDFGHVRAQGCECSE